MACKTSVSAEGVYADLSRGGESRFEVTSGEPCPEGCQHVYVFERGVVGWHIPESTPRCIDPKVLRCSLGGGFLVLPCESATPKRRLQRDHRVAHGRYVEGHWRPATAWDETYGLPVAEVWEQSVSVAMVDAPEAPVCAPCAEKYRKRVQQVFKIPMALARPGCLWFLTLTAPSPGVHCKRPGCSRAPDCSHEKCDCRLPDGWHLGHWNADLGRRWNRFCQDLYRLLRRYGVTFEYGRCVEVQDGKRRSDGVGRLALHEHVAMILDRPLPVSPALRSEIRKLAIRHHYGHAVDLQVAVNRGPDEVAVPGSRSANLLAWYISKYVTDATAVRPEVPWTRVDPGRDASPGSDEVIVANPVTGEVLLHRDAVPAVERSGGPRSYKTWTVSRGWGCSMGQVRRLQSRWWMQQISAAASLETLVSAAPVQAGGCALELDGCARGDPR